MQKNGTKIELLEDEGPDELQAVRIGDVLLLMEAGGSLFQFPAPAEGTVLRLCAAEGASVEAGQVLVILKEKEGSADA